MSVWVLLVAGLLVVIVPDLCGSDLVQLDQYALKALRSIITENLDAWVDASFNEANASLAEETGHYGICERNIKERMDDCGQCVSERCLESFNSRCGRQSDLQPDLDELICAVSSESCAAINLGKTAVAVLKYAGKKVEDAIKNGFKKVGSVAKKIILGPIGRFRIRLPRIQLPRIRLPRIRLPRIKIPRIRIQLPRIQLPRIRLPRIQLPRIQLRRFRVRFRRFGKRRRRQITEPTCDDISNDPTSSCSSYQSVCESCGIYGSPGSPQTMDNLITEVCGSEFLETANRVAILENRLGRLEEVYEIQNTDVFIVTSVQYDPYLTEEEGYIGVRASFVVLGENYNVTIPDPVPIYAQPTAGPLIAKWIFGQIFEDL